MPKHREVLVKVNAWVDAGIADLVTALSEIEGLVTIESCEGNQGSGDAFVYFRLGDWEKSGHFLFGKLLSEMTPDLRAAVALRLQAYDTDTAVGSITLDPAAVPAMVKCVRKLASPVGARVLVTRDAHGKAVA